MADPASRAVSDDVPGPAGRGWRSHAGTLELGSPATTALTIVVAFTVARLGMAFLVGLGTDESYSVSAASEWHLSYFDHPPIHYWIVRLFAPLLGHGRGARLPFILLFAGSSWLMYRLTQRLYDARAAAFAVFSLNVSAFFTIAAGGWVLPDGPLDFFLLAAAVILADLFLDAAPSQARIWRGWLLAGLFIGLAALSKYQAALFGVGVVAFLLSSPAHRRQLAHPAPYVGGLLCLVVLSPILIWNAGHGWASIGFQAGRGAPGHGIRPFGWLESLVGQMALLLPWIFAPMAIAGWRALRAGAARSPSWLCVMLALPPIAVFTILPILGPKGLPHWPMPGWLMLFPVLGAYLAGGPAFQGWRRVWAIGALAFAVVAGAAATVEASTGWLGQAFPATFKKGDPTVESLDWGPARAVLVRRGLLRPGGPVIVALKWNEAGKIDNAVGDLAPVTVFSNDPREYQFRHNPAAYVGRDALIIGKDATMAARLAGVSPYFRSIRPLPPIFIGRRGRAEIELQVALAHDLLRPYPQSSSASQTGR